MGYNKIIKLTTSLAMMCRLDSKLRFGVCLLKVTIPRSMLTLWIFRSERVEFVVNSCLKNTRRPHSTQRNSVEVQSSESATLHVTSLQLSGFREATLALALMKVNGT